MSLVILQSKVQTALVQVIQQQLNVFNTASAGSIVMTTGDQLGDTMEQLSWGLVSGLVTDRNAYAAPGTPAFHRVMTQLMTNKINLSGKAGPVVITEGMLKKLQTNIDEVAARFATMASQAILQKYVRVAFGASYGAISGNADAVRTAASPIAPLAPVGSYFPTLREMELSAALFGDQAGNIKAWLMNGSQFANLKAYDVLDNPVDLYKIDSVRVASDASGRVFVISDALSIGNAIIGLAQAGVVIDTGAQTTRTGQDITGENVTDIMRVDFDYGVSVKGYRVKEAVTRQFNGIKSYAEADAVNADNWELIAAAGQDNAPITPDGVNPNVSNAGGQGGNTGTLMQQKPQDYVPISIKETAGVLMKLSPSTLTNTTTAGS